MEMAKLWKWQNHRNDKTMEDGKTMEMAKPWNDGDNIEDWNRRKGIQRGNERDGADVDIREV